MKIIQNSQQHEKQAVPENLRHTSLIHKPEPPQIEKNIIVDNADLELEGCLEEGEEWMFKTFNRKKRLEEQAQQDSQEGVQKEAPKEETPKQPTSYYQKPPHNSLKSKLDDFNNEKDEIENLKMIDSNPNSNTEAECVDEKRRRRKNSKHRRTESKTFDKDFLQTICTDV